MMITAFKKTGKVVALVLGLSAISLAGQAESLKLGTDGSADPWTFKDSAGTLMGFDIDIGNEVCKRIKADCEWVIHDWNGIFPALALGKFNMIFAGVASTDERRKTMDFSRSYLLSLVGFAAKKNSDLVGYQTDILIDLDNMNPAMQAELDKVVGKLKGKTMGMQSGANMIGFFEASFSGSELREYEKLETRDLDMQAERLDAGMAGSNYWKKVEKKKEVDILTFGPKFANGPLGGGIAAPIRKGQPELTKRVNAAIDTMVADGTVASIAKKWFGSSEETPTK